MLLHSFSRPVVVIVGATGVGKSDFAIRLAKWLDAEIVSADSRLFYRGMDIGTAKPSKKMQAEIPHYLIDVVDPDETWSLAVFQKEAKKAIDVIHEKGKTAIIVGGTGQYIRAVLEEWELPPQSPDMNIRKTLENWANEIGIQELHKKLELIDPAAAEKIDPTNMRRTIRALEVILLTGKRFSEQRKKGKPVFDTITIGLWCPRVELYQIIDQRIENMLSLGFVNEVKNLLEKGYPPDSAAMSAIGYKQLISYLQGEITYEEAVRLIKRMTRIFVRRQSNWFKQEDPSIHWVRVDESTLINALEMINNKRNWSIHVE
jgi:tRNA dimethylallyltransferase